MHFCHTIHVEIWLILLVMYDYIYNLKIQQIDIESQHYVSIGIISVTGVVEVSRTKQAVWSKFNRVVSVVLKLYGVSLTAGGAGLITLFHAMILPLQSKELTFRSPCNDFSWDSSQQELLFHSHQSIHKY